MGKVVWKRDGKARSSAKLELENGDHILIRLTRGRVRVSKLGWFPFWPKATLWETRMKGETTRLFHNPALHLRPLDSVIATIIDCPDATAVALRLSSHSDNKSAMTMNNSQMQIKLSTTFMAEAIEVEHATVLIFPPFVLPKNLVGFVTIRYRLFGANFFELTFSKPARMFARNPGAILRTGVSLFRKLPANSANGDSRAVPNRNDWTPQTKFEFEDEDGAKQDVE